MWDASTLTTLKPGSLVTVAVLPDDESPMVSDLCLSGRVMAIELCEYVAIPWAQWLPGVGRHVQSTLLLGWEDFEEALDTDCGCSSCM